MLFLFFAAVAFVIWLGVSVYAFSKLPADKADKIFDDGAGLLFFVDAALAVYAGVSPALSIGMVAVYMLIGGVILISISFAPLKIDFGRGGVSQVLTKLCLGSFLGIIWLIPYLPK